MYLISTQKLIQAWTVPGEKELLNNNKNAILKRQRSATSVNKYFTKVRYELMSINQSKEKYVTNLWYRVQNLRHRFSVKCMIYYSVQSMHLKNNPFKSIFCM